MASNRARRPSINRHKITAVSRARERKKSLASTLGRDAEYIIENASSAHDLLKHGLNARQIKARGFSIPKLGVRELIKLGYSPRVLFREGHSIHELINSGLSIRMLLKEGITIDELLKAGFLIQLSKAGIPYNKLLRVTSTRRLIDGGFSVRFLLNHGYTARNLIDAGLTKAYIAKELLRDGLSQREIKRFLDAP